MLEVCTDLKLEIHVLYSWEDAIYLDSSKVETLLCTLLWVFGKYAVDFDLYQSNLSHDNLCYSKKMPVTAWKLTFLLRSRKLLNNVICNLATPAFYNKIDLSITGFERSLIGIRFMFAYFKSKKTWKLFFFADRGDLG